MNSETLADIIREMRNRADTVIEGRVITARNFVPQETVEDWADRIEAARKREQADPLAKPNLCRSCKHLLPDGCEICGCGDYVEAAEREHNRQYGPMCDWSIGEARALANTLANHGLRDGNADAASSCIYALCRNLSSTGNAAGNAAAMRAALEAMLEECCNLCDVPNQMSESGHTCSWRNRWSGCQSKAIDNALAALSAPPRNCDGFRTAEEAENAFVEFCARASSGKVPNWRCPITCGHIDPSDWVTCCIKWFFAPAEGKEASNG